MILPPYYVSGLQLLIALLSALLFCLVFGIAAAEAAFYGGVVAAIGSFLHERRVRRIEQVASQVPAVAPALMQAGAATRFVLTLALFGAGFGIFRITPVPALAAFAVAQLAYAWAIRKSYKEQK